MLTQILAVFKPGDMCDAFLRAVPPARKESHPW
jgi:hypothetical protein